MFNNLPNLGSPQVKAEHVVPGIKAIIAEGDAALAALEVIQLCLS